MTIGINKYNEILKLAYDKLKSKQSIRHFTFGNHISIDYEQGGLELIFDHRDLPFTGFAEDAINKTKVTCYHGLIHSIDDAPAYCYADATAYTQTWYDYGVVNRDRKPAIIAKSILTGMDYHHIYMKQGVIHNDYGPALITFAGSRITGEQYYLNFQEYSKKDFWEKQKGTEYAIDIVISELKCYDEP